MNFLDEYNLRSRLNVFLSIIMNDDYNDIDPKF